VHHSSNKKKFLSLDEKGPIEINVEESIGYPIESPANKKKPLRDKA